MLRVLLTIILPLLLPTALYLVWVAGFGRTQPAGAIVSWRGPWVWLALAGLVLAALALAALAQLDGAPDGTYVAPHLENGRVVPGHVVPK